MAYDFKYNIGDTIDYNGTGTTIKVFVWGHHIQLNEDNVETPYYRFGPLEPPYKHEDFHWVDAKAMDNPQREENDPPPKCPTPPGPPC